MRSSVMPPRPSGELDRARDYTIHQPSVPYQSSQPQRPHVRPTAPAVQAGLKLAPVEGWLPMILLAIAVYTVISSIIASGWVTANTNLVEGAGVGLLVGFLVAKTRRFPQVILHLGACLVGYWLSVFLTSAAYHVSWLLLMQNLRSVISGGLVSSFASGGDMVFLFYLTFLSFFLGYFGAWLIYRAHLPWLVALIYCAIMLVNLQYARSDLSLLVVALVGALLLLIARMHLNNQLARWSQEGLHTDRTWLRNITTRFTWVAALMAALILSVSMILPMVNQPSVGVSLWNGIDNFWTNITHGQFSLDNPGSAFQPYQPATNFFGSSLSITGNVNLPTGQVLYYTSTSGSQPHYLEGFTYDYFDGHTWTSRAGSNNVSYGADATLPMGVMGNFSQVTTTVTVVNPPAGDYSYIFAPDVPNSFSVPTTLYGPDDMTTAWTQQTPLKAEERYQVISSIPAIAPQVLSSIPLPGVDGAIWSNDPFYSSTAATYYLQKPADLSPQVMATLKSWTAGAPDAYDAMRMLVAHFTDQTQFVYSVTNPPVPSNIDAVSWLLQTHRGYCTYYATAMTIMARMLGLPARVVSGFSQGHLDSSRNVWEVDGTNAHSWVQVYFPGQGWVNFDPTPGFSLNNPTNSQPTPPTGTSPTPVKPVPSATGTHPRPGTHPTPPANTSNNGGNAPGAGDGTGGMLFLDFSLVILVAALLALVVAGYRYRLSKLYATLPIISRLYWRVSRLASLSGAEPRPSQTPYEYTRVLSQRFPRAQTALWHITHLFVRERWGGRQHLPRETEVQDVERLWPTVRNDILRSLPGRLRASRRTR